MKIFLTGRDGQVGWELQRALRGIGEVHATARSQLNLEDGQAVREAVRGARPGVIINAAAYTAVDLAEGDEAAATRINGVAPGILAEEGRKLGALLIHYSTDYVFAGDKNQPYTEDDAPGPINAYGRSKLAGELAIAAAGGRYLILRTCWVYGPRGRNFFLTMRQLLATRDEVRVVDDQAGSPTASYAIADATAALLQAALREGQTGIYNVACTGDTTWFGFATRIAALLKQQGPQAARARITAIDSASYPTKARRPHYSVLDGERLRSDFGISMPSWETALERVVCAAA